MIDEMNKMNETSSELSEEEIGNVSGGTGVSAEITGEKWETMYCPYCRSENTSCVRTEMYPVLKAKVIFRVYTCKDCKQEFRITPEINISRKKKYGG